MYNSIKIKQEEIGDHKSVLLIFCALTVFFILLGTHHYLFSIIAFAISIMVIILYNEITIPYFLFLVPLASIFKISPSSMSLLTFVQLIYIGYWFFRNKVVDVQILKIFFFIMYVIVVACFCNSFSVSTYIKLFSKMVFLWSVFHEMRDRSKNVDIEICALSYILGELSGIVLSLCNSSFFRINEYIRQVVEQFGSERDRVVRFSGLAGDPNYFVLGIIISMCLCIVLLYQNKMRLIPFCVLFSVFIISTAATGSKSGMIMLVWPIFLFLRGRIMKKSYLAFFISFIILIIIVLLIIHGRIQLFSNTLRRLNSGATDVDALTTNRTKIWQEYIKYFIDNPDKALWGNGASTYILNLPAFQNRGHAVHNAYLDLVLQLGIIGIVFFVNIIYGSINHVIIPRNILNYSIIIPIIVMYMFLNQLSDYEWPYHLLLGLMVFNAVFQDDSLNYRYHNMGSKYIKTI